LTDDGSNSTGGSIVIIVCEDLNYILECTENDVGEFSG
jgi:hypothetical protein